MDTTRVIIFVAVIAILWVFIQYSGLPIPAPIIYVILIVAFALLCIYAIKFLNKNA